MRVANARDLGAVARDRRQQLQLSQAALAERLGVSRQWVVSFERGKPSVELGLALRALAALGLVLVAAPAASGDDLDLDEVFEKLWLL